MAERVAVLEVSRVSEVLLFYCRYPLCPLDVGKLACSYTNLRDVSQVGRPNIHDAAIRLRLEVRMY
jgi:hypothetical protein